MTPFAGALLAVVSSASVAAGPSLDPALPQYEPRALQVSDAPVRIVGYNDMHDLLEPLVRRFTSTHPGVAIELDLPGTRFAPSALATGTSVLAPMGAEFTPPQLAKYRARTGADPLAFRVAHTSLDPHALSGPLAVFVHRDNPLPSLSVPQLQRIFSGAARTWGELGAQGEWSKLPIGLYGMQTGTALAYEMKARTLTGTDFSPTLRGFRQSSDVAEQVGHDPQGIGFAAAMRTTPQLRTLPIAVADGAPPFAPTVDNVMGGRYPLDRYLWVFAKPPLSPFAREFLRLVLSREGQQAVLDTPQGYIPLSAAEVARELANLD
jgi:phosphate transport system substrate-binding protein